MRGGAKFETRGADRIIRQRIQSLAGVTLTVGIHRGKMNQGVDVALYGAGITSAQKTLWDGS